MDLQMPLYITTAIVVVNLGVSLALWYGIGRITRRIGLSHRRRLTLIGSAIVIALGWLAIVPLLVGRIDITPIRPGAPTLSLLPFIVLPVISLYGALLVSPFWRELVDATPQHWIVGLEVYRVIGAVFLPVMSLGILPAYFAYPTAYGDLLAGIPAPFVAYWVYKRRSGWRRALIGWNLIGLADFVVAIGIGSGILYTEWGRRLSGEALVTAPLAEFPLVLIPTFVVPIGITLHLYSLTKLYWDRSGRQSPSINEGKVADHPQ